MTGFNPDDYVDVAQRIHDFYEKYPDGRLTTVDWDVKEGLGGKAFVWVHAKAYRDPEDKLPGDGIAWEPVPGPTSFTLNSELMNAQTAAWGRAIVALGFDTKKIASRQEVQARNGDPHGLQESRADNVPLDQITFTFGRHKGTPLNQIPTSYLEWWLTSDSAKVNKNQELRAAVELHLGLSSVAATDDIDDLPF